MSATAEHTYYRLRDCESDGVTRYYQADDALKSYIKAHCYHPLKIKTFDSYLGQWIERQVPCGKCYHCRETKINEWVSRMYAHLEDFKYCYFVTLTYRSIYRNQLADPYVSYIFDYLKDAAWFEDADNELHHFCFTPCLLVKKHYQDFLKRLRKNTGIKDITFFGCGEYGSKWSHPHFHFIIFSHEPIRSIDFAKAWGVYLSPSSDSVSNSRNSKHKVFKSFGRIQVDDLVNNGTISSKPINVDGQQFSAKSCFGYVAKYCGKKSKNTKRLQLIYNLLNDGKFYETKNDPIPYSSLDEFVAAFRPFICCSRGTPIGSLFFKRHSQQMAQGVFVRPPLLETQCYIVPSYFRRKASEFIYSLRSISPSGCFVKGNLQAMGKTLASYIQRELPKDLASFANQYTAKSPYFPVYSPSQASKSLNFILRSPDTLVDVVTRSRFMIEFDGVHFESLCVVEYKYSRTDRSFIPVCYHDLSDFCEKYLSCLPIEYKRYMKGFKLSKDDERFFSMVRDWYDLHDKTDRFLSMVDEVEADNERFFNMKNVVHLQNTNL